jgi:hypothetical protein
MLVKTIKYLFEKDYDNQYDLPLPFTFIGLNLMNKASTSYLQNQVSNFEIKPLPWYCINYPKEGDVLLIKVHVEEHPWGVKIMLFSP